MGTHNRLLSLGPERYLELIAVDPAAPRPPRPRWFALDTAAMAGRLAGGPALVHWVLRTDDIERDAAFGAAGEVLEMQRGDYRWRIAVPADGALADEGTRPTLIQWLGERPPRALPDVGIRLQRLVLRHSGAPSTLEALRGGGFAQAACVEASAEGPALCAQLRTPRGVATLPE
jgi:hypothetical protein